MRCAATGIPGHKCWGPLTKQHWPKRGMGGIKKNPLRKSQPSSSVVAMLCAGIHDAIDNGMKYQGRRMSNDVTDGKYRIVDLKTAQVLVEVDALR